MADNQIETIETREVGRPCKYETHVEPYLDKIFEWLKTGYTDVSICEQLGIHQNTWMRYKQDYSVLSELYARARTYRNALVMNKMFQKATGEKVTLLKQKATKDGKILDLKEEAYIPPDVNAADLFLRNNDPEYRSAKMDLNSLTLVQNNYSLDDLEAKRLEVLKELKRLEMATDADFKVISDS
jgi:hypothetical protein